jgi:hypothetical protein
MLPKDSNRLCRNKYVKLDGKFSPNNELIIYKIATRSHMSPTAIERGVMWVCYPCDILISVKVYPSTVFSKLKSLNISALEEDRKTMAFDIQGWLLPVANVRSEINCLRSFAYDLSLSV